MDVTEKSLEHKPECGSLEGDNSLTCKGRRKKIDPVKLVLYSEIMKPKFDDRI